MTSHYRKAGRAAVIRRLGIGLPLVLVSALTVAAGLTATPTTPETAPSAFAVGAAKPSRDSMPAIIGEWAATADTVPDADPAPAPAAAATNPLAVGNFIVAVHAGKLDQLLASKEIAPSRTYHSAVQGFSAELTASQLAELRADPRVVSISQQQTFTGFAQTVTPVITRIEADAAPAWAGAGRSSSADLPTVAVVDSGVEAHPDLNVVGQVNCSSETTATDMGGHGTGVAGVLAARDDTKGVVGIAPGAPVYSVKVMNKSNQGTTDSLLCGLNWISAHAAEFNIQVVNLSLGTRGSDDGRCGANNSDPIHLAVCSLVDKGVTVVAAAGHISADLAGTIPAAYDEVLTATNMADWDGKPGGLGSPPCKNQNNWIDDRPASDTNYAVSAADIAHTVAAPGACPYTTLRGARYGYLAGGTSMSSAATSGVVLNCLRPGGLCVGKSPAQIRQIVIDQAKNATLTSDHGYTGDPRTSVGRYYGWLVTARLEPLPVTDPSASGTPTASGSPTATATATPTAEPTVTPTPSVAPTTDPTPSATVTPTTDPTPSATVTALPSPDTTAPTVRLISPAPGAWISGIVELQASASDDVGVTAVSFLLGEEVVGLGAQRPDGTWRASLDTTPFANNVYDLRARAVDAAGNSGSVSQKIRIDNTPAPPPGAGTDTSAPVVALTSPTSGALVSGNVRLVADASDNVGVTAVTFWVRTSRIGTGIRQPDGSWQATVSTTGFANGVYDITAKATDAAGNQGTSPAVTVRVAN